MTEDDLVGFAATEDGDNVENAEGSKKKAKKGGGFQSMGFDQAILKGITNRGYKIPTPIQRKVPNLMLYRFAFLHW